MGSLYRRKQTRPDGTSYEAEDLVDQVLPGRAGGAREHRHPQRNRRAAQSTHDVVELSPWVSPGVVYARSSPVVHMKRLDLWAAYNAASENMIAVLDDFERDSTPANRAKTHAAIRQYIECLHPLIGHEAAFRYEASWRRFEDATARLEQLNATMASLSPLDATDAELMRELEQVMLDTSTAFALEQVALKTLLDEALERDQKG
jgi:hypothetical protein